MYSPRLSNAVRARREARGWSQAELALAVGLSRQSVNAIEGGRASPSVDVALRLSRALDATVEGLFAPAPSPFVDAVCADAKVEGRVALALVRDRLVAHGLSGEGARISADGVVVGRTRRAVSVELTRPLDVVRENVVVMGCATGLGLLADRLHARTGAGRFVWLPRSSTVALTALARGEAHIAGVHLIDGVSGEANVDDVRRAGCPDAVSIVTFAHWDAGLLMRREHGGRIRGIVDVTQKNIRLIARETGSGARRLLERELRSARIPRDFVKRAPSVAKGHDEVARAIAMGFADVGVATRDVAMAHDLAFVPLAEERYDLVVPTTALADPRIARFFDAMTSASFRREISVLGYDTEPTGERVAEVAAT